jgi:DNA-binding SARP family transcriptional activator/TolB-like protein/Tfp pilus assembly protein PilF
MIRLRTLGGVDLRDDDGREIRRLLAQPKRVALLAYLALAGPTGYRRRDKVVALFWPELDDAHARSALRQALTFLRRTLDDDVILTRGEEDIGVNRSRLACDAYEISNADSDEDVLARYDGDFLDGFHVSDVDPDFQSWIEEERLRLRRRATVAAWTVAEQKRANGELRESATLARRAATLARDDEAETRRLVAWLDELGDRAGAIGVYEEFAQKLLRDFDAHPAPETQALIARVRARTRPSIEHESTPKPPKTSESPAARESAAPPSQARPPSMRTWIPIVAALALVIVAVVARGLLGRNGASRSSEPDVLTVAVLPLRDLTPDTSTRYIADGLTDELITNLAQGSAMRVISSRTMLAYRDSSLAPDVIAQRLDAQAIVSGSVQYVGDTVHLTIQLTRAGEAGTLFGRSFTGTRGDLLRMQRDVARTLLRQIDGGQIVSSDVDISAPRIANGEAEELYIRGRHYWNRRGEGNLVRSIGLFTQALDSDPLFARAYAGIADAYVQLGYGSLLPPADAFPKAEAAARRALELDSTLAEPHASLGFVHLYYRWEWPAAESEFKRAIALNPSYATAYEWYGLFLAAMGRFDEAIRNERRAQELDPLSAPVAATAAWVQYYAGRLSDARREIGTALRMDSSYALGRLYLGRILQQQGHLDSALSQYSRTGALREWIPTMAGVAFVQAELGQRAEATATLARMKSASTTRYVSSYTVALVHAALGERDSAFAVLHRAERERTHWIVWLNRDPRWASIRDDRRYLEIARSVGLPP